MKEYGSCDLRNIAILAHGKAGKTSLTEALAYNAGHTNRLGKVDDGTTVADFERSEVNSGLPPEREPSSFCIQLGCV